ncbi:MAG: GHKL domain-containing protein [Butyrivibrio sp.]|nr:GHKL domain-containing protein [Butyrivibrio sp.]
MNITFPKKKLNIKLRYGVKDLVEFERSEPVKMQKSRTAAILLTGFIVYSILATLLSSASYRHGKVTNISLALFFFVLIVLNRITKNHTELCIMGAFGACVILFFHMITEVDWTIGMDAFWLYILILPFLTDFLAGVIYGSIGALSGFILSILLFDTPLKNYLQPYGSDMTNWFPIAYIVVMLTAAVIEYELTTYQIEKKISDEKVRYLLSERTNRLQEQLSVYESNELTIRKYKHDIRHFNRVLAGFINDGEYDKAKEYLTEFDSLLENVTAVSFCDNKIVNELLTIYAARCQKKGFKLRAKASIPEQIPMEQVELTSLVANALENALEAQEKVDSEKRFIQIEITYDGRRLKLMTKNPCAGDVHFKPSGLPESSKEIRSGIGTYQIKNIATKYGGAASFETRDGLFVLKAVMTCM